MDNKNNMILKIHSIYNSLTKKEKEIASYIIKNSKEIIYLSITDLSEKSGVGETTIIRFCKHLSFKGFYDFKLELAKNISSLPVGSLSNSYINENDTLKVLLEKITNENINNLNNNLKLLSENNFEQAANLMLNANKIVFFGVGDSSYTILDAKFKFMRLGLNVDANIDGYIQKACAVTLTDKDVAICISLSGSSKETLEYSTLAKELGAKVICITNEARSPLSKISDISLFTSVSNNPLRNGCLASKIAQLHILDMLYTCISLKLKILSSK